MKWSIHYDGMCNGQNCKVNVHEMRDAIKGVSFSRKDMQFCQT